MSRAAVRSLPPLEHFLDQPPTEVDFDAEVAKKVHELIARAASQAATDTQPISVDTALAEFAADRKQRGCTKTTIERNYLPFFRRFFAPDEFIPIDPIVIAGRLASYQNLATHLAYWLNLSALYSFLAEKYGITNPMAKVRCPKLEETLPDHLNPEEKQRLRQVPLSPRDRAIVDLFHETAVRPGEVFGGRGHPLRFCDIYKDHIEVSGKRGERMVPVTAELRDKLLSLRDGRPADAPVFIGDRGEPLSRWGISRVIRDAYRAASIDMRKAHPYVLRHSFAAEFLANGGDLATLQKILGHKRITTTMRYTHISDKAMVDIYRRTVRGANNIPFVWWIKHCHSGCTF
jgi:site-specific recombinase XerD